MSLDRPAANLAPLDPSRPPPILALEGISRRFSASGGFLRKPRTMTAVRKVSLSITRGEIVGVVGESGCGKSTFARLAMRLIEPSEGKIRFEGEDVTTARGPRLRNLRKKLQMVFQDPYSSLDPRYTVRDCLEEPFRALRERVPPGRIEALLDQVGLPRAFADTYPHQMSGGQRQRVGIARALAHAPEFILLDEPTASLDVSIQAQIIGLLQQLHAEQGLTYLFISHDLGLVRYFCSRIVVMYLGSVVEVMVDPKAPPRHPYTAALMASSFAPDPQARQQIVPLEGEIPSPFHLPQGCPFAPRCPRALARCTQEVPALQPIAAVNVRGTDRGRGTDRRAQTGPVTDAYIVAGPATGEIACFNPLEAQL